tara:strand:- start:1354 stop:1542 length:189 start_codon:yes stop_codon:yes gene_type:complete
MEVAIMVATNDKVEKVKKLSKKEWIRKIAETPMPQGFGDFNHASLERTNIDNLELIFKLQTR